jgi:hypothetical protein
LRTCRSAKRPYLPLYASRAARGFRSAQEEILCGVRVSLESRWSVLVHSVAAVRHKRRINRDACKWIRVRRGNRASYRKVFRFKE